MRRIENAVCSCGGKVRQVDTTENEERVFGCGNKGCCCQAVVCEKCGVRFTLGLSAPEIDW